MSLLARTTPLREDRPLLDLVPAGVEPLVWVRHDEGLVGWGETVRIDPGSGADRIVAGDAALTEHAGGIEVDDEVGMPGTGVVALTSLTFEDGSAGSTLVVPRVVVGRREGRTWVTRIGRPNADDDVPGPDRAPAVAAPGDGRGGGRDRTGGRRGGGRDRTGGRRGGGRDRTGDRTDGARVRYAGASKPDLHWLEAVASALHRIDAGELGKVVLARDHAVWSRQPFDALVLARRLHRRFRACFTFVVEGLVGATPELLVDRFGDRVGARVLAGTTGRSEDEAADAELGARLLASDKDRREHAFAADSVREALAQLCAELVGDAQPRLLRLDNVQHLATRYHGTLAGSPPPRLLELAARLHPTAAVGGTPTDRARALIRELEGMDRGRYAGPIGWVDAAGDGELGIALRCAELSGATARLFAGAGIVSGSLPEAELEETRLKLRAMQGVMDPGARDAHVDAVGG